MKKKLSKVLAVVLSLVLAVGLAAVDGVSVAQAAKAKKIKLTTNSDSSELTSGQTVVIKAKGKNAKKAKWSIKGDTTFAELNKTKGNKVKLTVKENATGTVKVVAKVTKKNKASVSFTLSCEADAITVTDAEGFTNEAIALTTTPTPSNAKLGDVTYAVYTDETATTEAKAEEAAVADGALTAKVAGTYYVIAKTTTAAGEISSPAAKVVVTEKLANVTAVEQTRKNIIKVTFDADASKVTTDDLLIENANGTRINVKTIELDEAKTVATVTTLVNMADGKEYTVTYGESSTKFTATTGEVTDIKITPVQIPVNVETDISAVAVDANGVILDEVKYSDGNMDYQFEIELGETAELTGNQKLKMTVVGSSVKVKVVYNTNQLDANGDLKTFDAEQTITAVAAGNITGYTLLKFIKHDYGTGDYWGNAWNGVDKVRVDGGAEGSFWVATVVYDDLGYERVNGSLTEAGYTLASADDTYLLVEGDKVTGVREGKTQILVMKDNEVVFPIPVEIQAASKLTTVEVANSSVTLSAGNYAEASEKETKFVPADSTFTFVAKDQYGEVYRNVTATESGSTSNYDYMLTMTLNQASEWADTGYQAKVVDPDEWQNVQPEDKNYLKEGSSKINSYTVTITDTKDNSISLKKTVNVTVRRPLTTIKTIALSINKGNTMGTEDTALVNTDSDDQDKTVEVRLACYDKNGVFIEHASLPGNDVIEETEINAIELRKGNAVTADKIVADAPVEGLRVEAGEKVDLYEFVSRTVAADANEDNVTNVVTKAGNGSYRINVKGVKLVTSGSSVSITYDNKEGYNALSANITVKDTQKGITTNQEVKSVDMVITDGNVADVAKMSVSVQAPDAKADNTSHKYDPAKESLYKFGAPGVKLLGKSAAFTKLTVYVPYGKDDVTAYLPVPVSVNYTVLGN